MTSSPHERANELRRSGDAAWNRGNKELAAQLHEQARRLEAEATATPEPRFFADSRLVPDGAKKQDSSDVRFDLPYEVEGWSFRAHVEMRPSGLHERLYNEPPLGKGDVWYRLVLSMSHMDEDGPSGEISTPWSFTPEIALESAKLMIGVVIPAIEDNVSDDGPGPQVVVNLNELFDRAVKRFHLVTGT